MAVWAAWWLALWRCVVGKLEFVAGVKTMSGLARPTEAVPADVVIVLKSSLWLLLSLRRAPDENLDLWIGRWWHFSVVSFLKALSWSSQFVVIQLHPFTCSSGRASMAL